MIVQQQQTKRKAAVNAVAKISDAVDAFNSCDDSGREVAAKKPRSSLHLRNGSQVDLEEANDLALLLPKKLDFPAREKILNEILVAVPNAIHLLTFRRESVVRAYKSDITVDTSRVTDSRSQLAEHNICNYCQEKLVNGENIPGCLRCNNQLVCANCVAMKIAQCVKVDLPNLSVECKVMFQDPELECHGCKCSPTVSNKQLKKFFFDPAQRKHANVMQLFAESIRPRKEQKIEACLSVVLEMLLQAEKEVAQFLLAYKFPFELDFVQVLEMQRGDLVFPRQPAIVSVAELRPITLFQCCNHSAEGRVGCSDLKCNFVGTAAQVLSHYDKCVLAPKMPCPFDGHCQTCALDPFERAGVLFVDQIKAHFNVCQHLVFYCRNCSIDLKNLNKAALQELIAKHVLAHQIAQDQKILPQNQLTVGTQQLMSLTLAELQQYADQLAVVLEYRVTTTKLAAIPFQLCALDAEAHRQDHANAQDYEIQYGDAAPLSPVSFPEDDDDDVQLLDL